MENLISFYFILFQNFFLQQKHSTDNVIQKNKQGRLVITLVVIFLICHTPNAVYTFYKNFHLAPQHDDHDSEAMKIKNFILGKMQIFL